MYLVFPADTWQLFLGFTMKWSSERELTGIYPDSLTQSTSSDKEGGVEKS